MNTFKPIRFSALFRWILMLAVFVVPQVVQAQWNATVGAQSENLAHQALAFLPNEIWIHAGDSITWTFQTNEIHTVSFLKSGQVRLPLATGCPGFAPDGTATVDGSTCVTTGPLTKGKTFTVTFPTAGNFKIVCLVHINMTGVVHVLSLSQPLPHDQEFYDDQAATQRHALLSDTDRHGDHERDDSDAPPSLENQVIAGTDEIAGTAGGSQTVALMRFVEPTIVIHAGETVEWSNVGAVATHTITFGPEPTNLIPPSASVTLDADGARHAIINAPTDKVHSGFIAASPQDRVGLPQSPVGITRFRVTFTNPGVYPYICALHDQLGMKGTVIVLP